MSYLIATQECVQVLSPLPDISEEQLVYDPRNCWEWILHTEHYWLGNHKLCRENENNPGPTRQYVGLLFLNLSILQYFVPQKVLCG